MLKLRWAAGYCEVSALVPVGSNGAAITLLAWWPSWVCPPNLSVVPEQNRNTKWCSFYRSNRVLLPEDTWCTDQPGDDEPAALPDMCPEPPLHKTMVVSRFPQQLIQYNILGVFWKVHFSFSIYEQRETTSFVRHEKKGKRRRQRDTTIQWNVHRHVYMSRLILTSCWLSCFSY